MMRKTTLMALLLCASRCALAGEVYDGYQAFFDRQAGQVFTSPVSSDYLPSTYDSRGVPQAAWQGRVGNRSVSLVVGDQTLRINGKRYEYSRSVRLPSDGRGDVDPRSITLYVTRYTKNAGPMLCLESTGTGSGSADRYAQVYVINQAQSKFTLLKLPSLFGSCRGLIEDHSELRFPAFSYRRAGQAVDPVGTDVQYYSIVSGRYVPTSRRLATRFVEPGNVFKFEVE
ncbi:hypothetical protein PBP221_62120 (plasmid) [Paraburkholderia sp. 22B1P]|nr:hypothetical protein PBP221_62120 [Paraburkholderia sp. 22B1P]